MISDLGVFRIWIAKWCLNIWGWILILVSFSQRFSILKIPERVKGRFLSLIKRKSDDMDILSLTSIYPVIAFLTSKCRGIFLSFWFLPITLRFPERSFMVISARRIFISSLTLTPVLDNNSKTTIHKFFWLLYTYLLIFLKSESEKPFGAVGLFVRIFFMFSAGLSLIMPLLLRKKKYSFSAAILLFMVDAFWRLIFRR